MSRSIGTRIAQFKKWWGGKLIVKGIMDAEDARRAADIGADAIIVSNHGGRQLDGAVSSIRALPAIIDAVGDRMEVHFDSGIRSGQDVLKAVALGAKGTYVGRAFTYGLGAMGESGCGPRHWKFSTRNSMCRWRLCGETDIHNVGPHILYVPQGFGDPTVLV